MSAVLEAQRKHLRGTIESLSPNYICSVEEQDLATSLSDQHRIDVPVLDLAARTIEPREEKRRDQGDFGFYDYTGNVYTATRTFRGAAVVIVFRPKRFD